METVTYRSRARFWLLFLLFVAAGVSLVAVPMYVIRPFRAQGARELEVALAFVRWAPVWTVVDGVLAAVFAVMLWRGSSVTGWRTAGRRLIVLAGILLVTSAAVMARVNIFERVFRPVTEPQFLTASEAPVDDDDMVLAVRVGEQARAYPVRTLAYHHLLNDTLAGEPLIVTY